MHVMKPVCKSVVKIFILTLLIANYKTFIAEKQNTEDNACEDRSCSLVRFAMVSTFPLIHQPAITRHYILMSSLAFALTPM